jgi:hypothetical protein
MTMADESLEKLLVTLFARSYKPYSFGSFGKPTRPYIRAALAANHIVCSFNAGHSLTGAAIFTIAKRGSAHKDFSQRECVIPGGSLYVRHLAVSENTSEATSSLVEELGHRAQGAPVWLEIHEENEQIRRQIEEQFSFKYVMTKIMASSDIKGVYFRGACIDNQPPLCLSDVPSLKCLRAQFLSPAEINGIVHELNQYTSRFGPWPQHYSHYNKRHSWTAFALRGYCSSDPTFIAKPAEMSKRWKSENPKLLKSTCDDTTAARYFPHTMRIVRRIFGPKERIRFMRLAPHGGELSRHADITDREAGTRDGYVARLHIPLVTHNEVLFESWGLRGEHQEMHFAAGGLYYLDQRKPHRVVNRSLVERIHLVIDAYSSQALRELLQQ